MLLLLLTLQTSQALDYIEHPFDPEDVSECGIYPSCKQYGEGAWMILENCHRYINCTRPEAGGALVQHNMECPGDLVFDDEYKDCVDYNMATNCKNFQQVPCFYSCPRVYLDSIGGPADQYQERRIGCFRLSGTLFGGTMVHYQNENKQYLTPDSSSNPMMIHWIVSESPGAFNGGIRNKKFDYIKCPFDDWNDGWEVDTGLGNWVQDETMHVRCHKGDEGASTDMTPMVTTAAPTIAPPEPCKHDGPNLFEEDCSPDFLCCKWNVDEQEWMKTTCHCKNDNVFIEGMQTCTWPDFCEEKDDIFPNLRDDHYCDPADFLQSTTCEGA